MERHKSLSEREEYEHNSNDHETICSLLFIQRAYAIEEEIHRHDHAEQISFQEPEAEGFFSRDKAQTAG